MAKMIYRKDTGEILGVHIIGLHAADLIHEASNAVATKQSVQVCNRKHLPVMTLLWHSQMLLLPDDQGSMGCKHLAGSLAALPPERKTEAYASSDVVRYPL